jgi:hypothetical protein
MSIDTSSLRTINIKLTEKHLFNGKEETAIKPRRMTPHLWKLEYNINHQGKQFDYVSHKMFYNFYLY